jgi:hypothetical protein
MVEWLETLQTLVAAIVVLGMAAAGLFRYGSRIGTWFSELLSENRRLFWAAMGLVCWTITVGSVAWGVSFLGYVLRVGRQPDTPTDWASAASIGLLLASAVVAVLAGIPWLVLVGAVRLLRWSERRSGGRTQGE